MVSGKGHRICDGQHGARLQPESGPVAVTMLDGEARQNFRSRITKMLFDERQNSSMGAGLQFFESAVGRLESAGAADGGARE